MSMTLAEILRIKEERGYSVAKLSEYSGVPIGTLQKLLRGESKNPRRATLDAIEKVLRGDEKVYPGKAYEYEVEGKKPDRVEEPAVRYGDRQTGSAQGGHTLQDYYALPDDRRVELIDGVFYDMAAPSLVHQQIAGLVYAQIRDFIEENEGDCMPFIAPVDVQLECDRKTMMQPDVLIVCDPKKLKSFGVYGAPDFVLEVLSPSTKKKDMLTKLPKYMEAGVKEYWVIDPERKVLIVYLAEERGMPSIYPLQGTVGVQLYAGRLQIDLDRIDRIIEKMKRITEET
ncbi:MAG: Uma2 family endonuclease [Bacteroidales bacterium]|nr:Uma2 family endonuclease [Bacteroidales bacterium]MCM1415343.1 Uma2 family endonuclease [bacterium]MCM1424016.1 Uma2 family endonuclease [bacterium]